jgi:hypothetical protein
MRRRTTTFMLLMSLIICTMTAWTYPSGVSGLTRKTGGAGCAGCHSGASIDGIVTITGPTTLKVGQTGTYTLTISSGTLIGCDIAASSGTVAKVSSALQIMNGEVTQSQKMTGTSVQFTWTPSVTGTETLYATGAKNSKGGGWGHANDFSVAVTPAGTASVDEEGTPMAFSLEQNFPNPFNPATTIRFTLPRASDVSLTIMNILGEEVATLASRQMEQGTHALRWDASGIPSGMYLYRLKARQEGGQTFIETRKLLLLK